MSQYDKNIYDVGIIGGGIAGAAVARDAAMRGLRVILFEKNTFGSGTSSKSSKLIHGGIRYLDIAWKSFKHLKLLAAWHNVRFVFYSCNERRCLGRIAPHLIKPLPLLIPIYRTDRRRPLVIYFGAFLYYFLALLSGGTTRPTILWTAKDVLSKMPSMKKEGLLGGVIIWDSVTDDQSLVRTTIASARQACAFCYENTLLTGYFYNTAEKHYELTVLKNNTHETFYCRRLVNASGPWVDQIRAMSKERDRDLIAPVAGAHICVKPFTEHSAIIQAEDGRVFFVVHLGTHCRIGTTERFCENPDEVFAIEEEIDYLLRSTRKYFPDFSISRHEILMSDAGIRPLAATGKSASHNELSRDHEIIIGPSGVLHVIGVKLTDHRRAAEKVVDLLIRTTPKEFRRPLDKCRTSYTKL